MARTKAAQQRVADTGRTVENICAIAGLVVLSTFGLAETLSRLGVTFGPCHEHGFPWGQVIAGSILVLPKTVGRATAGKVWNKIASAVPGKKAD